MPRSIIILENIRSAYNVGNVIRTADALGWEVRLTGYSPSPMENPKVKKTSLGAEDHVQLRQFNYSEDAIEEAKKLGIPVIAAEITPEATSLASYKRAKEQSLAIIFGNEVEGVLPQTLKAVDEVVFIPMQGIKESLNIGQSSAIMMRELR
ncbi:MAG: TrmH family RNA methyltransferase [candidate division SR1 bacterium]|nr:MAG: TrmH family RNA methyltransferase [candidate division SR1 bacterium]